MTALSYIDTHTHLDDPQFAEDRDQVIATAKAAGVGTMINIGYRPERWVSTLALADRHPEVAFVLGLHPGHADEWSEQLFADLSALVSERRPVAIGEIGIDYHWTEENKAIQRVSFERQVELAAAIDLPVVIHQRSAARDVESVLRNAPESLRVILHSFDGDPCPCRSCPGPRLVPRAGWACDAPPIRRTAQPPAELPDRSDWCWRLIRHILCLLDSSHDVTSRQTFR